MTDLEKLANFVNQYYLKQKCNIVILKITKTEILLMLVVCRFVCLRGVICYTCEAIWGLFQKLVGIRSSVEGQDSIKIKL